MLWKQQVSIFVVIIWADYVLCFYSEPFSSKAVYAITSWEKAKQLSRGICLKITSCKFSFDSADIPCLCKKKRKKKKANKPKWLKRKKHMMVLLYSLDKSVIVLSMDDFSFS